MKKIFDYISDKLYKLWTWNYIDGKKWINDSMTEVHGENWLEKCMDELRDPEVRSEIRKELGL